MKARLIAPALAVLLVSSGALAQADVIQEGNARVSFNGKLSPNKLPRSGTAPVRVKVSAQIHPVPGKKPPQLQRIKIAINRHGHLNTRGLPVCRLDEIQPSTTQDALSNCRDSLVGTGIFSAELLVSGAAPFPSEGKMYAFNSVLHGRPAILAHVYGTKPAPASYTIPFEVRKAKGTYGLVLTAAFPQINAHQGYVSGLSLDLGRNFTYRGKRQSYLSAGCPAPKGLRVALFPFAQASFKFKARTLTSTLVRSCRVR
ncbi:MAG TPA: hypothetical protein VFL77_11285 [Solirubrobacterales bacterium]|nr:hypothetical protein [Solirubrobacterales bacterium]